MSYYTYFRFCVSGLCPKATQQCSANVLFAQFYYPVAACSSKHGGLAGTRFGWGLLKDKELAIGMLKVVNGIMLDYSVDVQLRVLDGLQAVLGKGWGCVPDHSGYITYSVQYMRVIIGTEQLTRVHNDAGAYVR